MLLAAFVHQGPDVTDAVQNGLGWFFLILCVANAAFGWCMRQRGDKGRMPAIWYAVGAVCLLLAVLYFLGTGPRLPETVRNISDYGLKRGLEAGGFGPTVPVLAANFLFWAALAVLVVELLAGYLVGGPAKQSLERFTQPVFRGMDIHRRVTFLTLVVTVLSILIDGTGAVNYFLLAVSGFAAVMLWRKTLTLPNVAWGILVATLFFGGLGMTDFNFRQIIIKPDNVPIVGLVLLVGFFTWLPLRRAVINDERMARGEPPLEKLEDEKVLVWPDLVYTELICMVVVTVVLVVWSVALPAPLEQPASGTATPNPSKAPWYFLGLQEMLVYYDPWIAGVVLPTIIIIGLMAIPYIDFNQKGNGYYTFDQRPFSIVMFLFGFIVLWVVLIFLGTFLRGPNWNFFGLFETWSAAKLVPLNNVDLSEYVWVRSGLGVVWESPAGFGTILARESPGIILVLAYFLILPPLLAKTVLRNMFIRMGFARYMILVFLLLTMASLPIKMVLRWAFNLKYIVGIPEYFFNI